MCVRVCLSGFYMYLRHPLYPVAERMCREVDPEPMCWTLKGMGKAGAGTLTGTVSCIPDTFLAP